MGKAFDLGDFIELPGGTVTSCCGQYRRHETKIYINAEDKHEVSYFSHTKNKYVAFIF